MRPKNRTLIPTDMQQDETDAERFATFDLEFEAWRKSWLESLIDDYGMLSRYRAANAALSPRATGESRVVFFGDSITEGWPLEDYFPGKPFINRGISAQTTPQMLLRFRQDAVALQPDAVVILAGTNDIGGNTGPMPLEDIAANIASMAEIAGANGARVVMCSLLPPSHRETLSSRYNLYKHPPAKIRALNRWLQDYTASNGHAFVNYVSALSGAEGFIKRHYSEDGLHPAPAGYAVMAKAAIGAIGKALARQA